MFLLSVQLFILQLIYCKYLGFSEIMCVSYVPLPPGATFHAKPTIQTLRERNRKGLHLLTVIYDNRPSGHMGAAMLQARTRVTTVALLLGRASRPTNVWRDFTFLHQPFLSSLQRCIEKWHFFSRVLFNKRSPLGVLSLI